MPAGMHYNYLDMADPFELYHKELAQSDRDPKTIERYQQIIRSYKEWLGGIEPDIANVKEYLARLRNKGYAPRSVILYYHVLQTFFDFIGIPLKLKLRKPETLPHYYDQGDFEALVRQAKIGLYHQTKEQRRRNQNLILVLGYTGMRKSELLNLTVNDIDFNNRTIRVNQSKNRKDRTLPMANQIVVPLREQCAGKSAHNKVFDNLNARSVYRIITGLAKACGLEGFHPHSLRHWFGTQLVERGASLRVLQELMGHESLETTSVYLDVTARHLRETIDLLDHTATHSAPDLGAIPQP